MPILNQEELDNAKKIEEERKREEDRQLKDRVQKIKEQQFEAVCGRDNNCYGYGNGCGARFSFGYEAIRNSKSDVVAYKARYNQFDLSKFDLMVMCQNCDTVIKLDIKDVKDWKAIRQILSEEQERYRAEQKRERAERKKRDKKRFKKRLALLLATVAVCLLSTIFSVVLAALDGRYGTEIGMLLGWFVFLGITVVFPSAIGAIVTFVKLDSTNRGERKGLIFVFIFALVVMILITGFIVAFNIVASTVSLF